MLALDYSQILPLSPANLGKVASAGKNLDRVQEFSSELTNLCEKLNVGLVNLKEVLSSLGDVLTRPPLFSEEERWFGATCEKCGDMLKSTSGVFDQLAAQLTEGVFNPLCDKVNKEIERLQSERIAYQTSLQEHEQALVRFSRMSKKKETEKTKFEGDGDLYIATKMYNNSAVDYYSSLNIFRYSHLNNLIDPILNLISVQATSFSNIQSCFSGLNRVISHAKIQQKRLLNSCDTVRVTVDRQSKRKLREFPLYYTPDPNPRDPFHDFLPIDQKMARKCGYLFIRSQKPGVKWDLKFMSTEKGQLVMYTNHKEPPEVVTPLSHVSVSSVDVDDRRYVFEVTNASKSVFLQAISDRECDEWMTTIRNLSQLVDDTVDTRAKKNRDSIVQERESIRMWISKELGSMKSKSDASRDRIPQHTFSARYLGSATMEVGGSRHASLVAALKKTIAEQSHGLIVREKMTVVIRADSIKCYDAVGKDFFTLPWRKLAYCGYVIDNDKLFGFVFPADDKNKDVCLMFEAETSGKAIWAACQKTIKLAHKKSERNKEKAVSSKRTSANGGMGSSPSNSQTTLKRSDSTQSILSDISDDMN